jgi:hypothetical protein
VTASTSPGSDRRVRRIRTRSWLLASPILLLAVVPLVANFRPASRRGTYFTRDFAADLLNSVEPYSVLVTDGDNDTFPLWYAQEVEGIRKDVVVACSCLLETDWNVRDIIRRPIFPYDAAAGPAIYRDGTWPKPTGPPLHLSMAQADAIPGAIEIQQPRVFTKDSIVATIRPGILSRGQLVILQLVKDAFPERPIFFSSRNTPDALGLSSHMIGMGLAQKLSMRTPVASPDTVNTPMGLMDVSRTLTLWTSVYKAPEQLVREGQWVDRASANIAYHYVLVGYYLANVLAQRGDRTASDKLMQTVQLMAHAAGLDRTSNGS